MLLIATWLIYSGMSKHNEAKTTFKKLGKLREPVSKTRGIGNSPAATK